MVDDRPVLLGMHNPLSADPRHALWPAPSRCTGWRLWRMLQEHTGAGQRDYIRIFDRRNVLDAVEWDAKRARAGAASLWGGLQGRRVVVLGREASDALRLPVVPEVYWREDGGVRWCYLPHPSGRCYWYNDPVNRAAAGLLLEELSCKYLFRPVDGTLSARF